MNAAQAPSTLYNVEVQGAELLVDRCSFRTLPAGGFRLLGLGLPNQHSWTKTHPKGPKRPLLYILLGFRLTHPLACATANLVLEGLGKLLASLLSCFLLLYLSCNSPCYPCEPTLSGLWLAGNEGMEKNMESTIMGYTRITKRIHSFIPS